MEKQRVFLFKNANVRIVVSVKKSLCKKTVNLMVVMERFGIHNFFIKLMRKTVYIATLLCYCLTMQQGWLM